ncbi:MAG: hypothetical protein Q8885_01485 [Candidatus Phytoplasma stylosanthis]|nr:hypothetical protein [Candidatus Phytoplasma stylosanthis]
MLTNSFYVNKKKYLKKIKKYALQNKIPIIHDETLLFLQKIIQKKKKINILEIGTAIGYSSLAMSNETNKIDTLERDYNKYQLSLYFFKKKYLILNLFGQKHFFINLRKNMI